MPHMSTEAQITAWLATQQDAMVAMLKEMVNTDSGSYNKPGIDAVGAVVQRFMAEQGIPVEVVRQQKHGDCLRASPAWDGPQGNAGVPPAVTARRSIRRGMLISRITTPCRSRNTSAALGQNFHSCMARRCVAAVKTERGSSAAETSVCRLSGEPFGLKLLLSEGCRGHEAMAFDQPGGVVEFAEFQQGLA
jgi:hypothetical protein